MWLWKVTWHSLSFHIWNGEYLLWAVRMMSKRIRNITSVKDTVMLPPQYLTPHNILHLLWKLSLLSCRSDHKVMCVHTFLRLDWKLLKTKNCGCFHYHHPHQLIIFDKCLLTWIVDVESALQCGEKKKNSKIYLTIGDTKGVFMIL